VVLLAGARLPTHQPGDEGGEIVAGDQVELDDSVVELLADHFEQGFGALTAALEHLLYPSRRLLTVDLATAGELADDLLGPLPRHLGELHPGVEVAAERIVVRHPHQRTGRSPQLRSVAFMALVSA
jgi:hypothetical protein